MSWVPPRLARRCVRDPLWLPIALALQLVLAVAVVLGLVTAPFSRHRRVLRASLLASVYLYLDVLLLWSAFGLWLRNLGRPTDPQAWRAAHAALLSRALSRLMAAARVLFGYQVQLVGRELVPAPGRPLVVLSRHAGPGDSFTLVHLLLTACARHPRVVLKQALQWDPGLDVVLSRLHCYFLPSRSGAGEDRSAAVADLVLGLTPDDALLLFPEGGNWTPRRHRRSVVRLLRAGHFRRAQVARDRTHVLPPRPGGASAALSARLDTDVLVIAHTGLDVLVNPGQMWRALPLHDRPMRIRGWLHPADEVPRAESAVPGWLDEQWALVDQWIGTQHTPEPR